MSSNQITVNGLFGIDYAIPYDRVTFQPLGVFQVIQEFNYEPVREIKKLEGGNAPGSFGAESGARENPLNMLLREFPEFALTEFEGASKTDNAAEASGNVGTLTNSKGTSIFDAVTGIASVAIDSTNQANAPFGRVAIVGTSTPAVVDIYVAGRPEKGFVADGGKIAEAVTIVASTPTVVADIGLEFTGGSGTIGMTEGDVAYLDVRGPNAGNSITVVGAGSEIREVGMMGVYPKRSDGSLVYVDFHRLFISSPMPIKGVSYEWADWNLIGEILVDFCNNNRLYTYYRMHPDISC